jgi:L-ascorbate 6-phosphate lactonase
LKAPTAFCGIINLEKPSDRSFDALSSGLAQQIANCKVPKGSLAIYWLCQAGFVFKTSAGKTIYIDPYLSDVVERVVGFKRMSLSPLKTEEVDADLMVCTHEHLDHMDVDALPVIAANPRTHFAGPIECIKEFEKLKIPPDRCHLLEEGKTFTLDSIHIHAVFADHGELAPDALGVVLETDGIKIYHTGDTAYRPEQFKPAIAMLPDVLLPCINGAFGNLDALEAALLTQLTSPRYVIPTHFWMFIEQNGEPKNFLDHCSRLAPAVQAVLLKPGEEFLVQQKA